MRGGTRRFRAADLTPAARSNGSLHECGGRAGDSSRGLQGVQGVRSYEVEGLLACDRSFRERCVQKFDSPARTFVMVVSYEVVGDWLMKHLPTRVAKAAWMLEGRLRGRIVQLRRSQSRNDCWLKHPMSQPPHCDDAFPYSGSYFGYLVAFNAKMSHIG
jgi:hypothetical protein